MKDKTKAATPASTSQPLGRREILTKGAAGLGLGLLGCAGEGDNAAPAIRTAPRLTWRLASSFPRSLDTIFGAAEVLASRVESLSEGRFRIRVYPSGEIVPPLQVLDAVQQGTVQLGHTASYYYTGKNPALAFDTAVPFGLTSRQQSAWLYHQGGLETMRGFLADFGIVHFPCGNTGAQMGGWFRREISSAADLRGLKMRIPGLGAQVLSQLGATVQTISGGEIYPALERGAIDATEWVGPYDDEKLGFFKVAKYYYYPGWWEPGPNLSMYVHQKAWDELPATYREIFTAATYEAHVNMQSRYDALNPAALTRLLAEGVELRRFPDDIMAAARTTAFEIMEDEASKDSAYRSLFDGWTKSREESNRWWSTTELAFSNFSFGPGAA